MTVGQLRTNLVGQTFGLLKVIGTGTVKGRAGWFCKCECGREKVVITNLLRTGRVRSCGCLKALATKAAHDACRTHGLSNSRVFRIWTGMLARCSNPTTISFPNYGARGISVCARWQSFQSFLDDMGHPPPGAQIDRIDNDGNYEPGNCRWATPRENGRNRRTNHVLSLDGEEKCITDWAANLGITSQGLHRRIHVLNWPLRRALTEGKRK